MTVNMIMLWWLGVLGVLLLSISPFHLLWWYPVSFAIGTLSLVFPFSLLTIPGQLFANLWCASLDRCEIERNERFQEEYKGLYLANLQAGMSSEEAKRNAAESLKERLDN